MTRRTRLRRYAAPIFALRGSLVLFALGLGLAGFGALVAFNGPLSGLLRGALGAGHDLVAPAVLARGGEAGVDLAVYWLGAGGLLVGLYLLVSSGRRMAIHVADTLNPDLVRSSGGGRVGTYLKRQQLAQGPRVVAIGGGTGLSTLLRGLKQATSNITAIVAVTDDGGSSGTLRQDKGMIPPGDIRACLVALADAETAMTDLFQHRFKSDSGGLSGHSIGNLLLAALADQAHGDFEAAIARASDVLAIRGEVMPATLSHVDLRATFEDGSVVEGETAIAKAGGRIARIELTRPDVEPYLPALDAIAEADLICLGPGSVFTSVIPPLLVPGMAEALRKSPAKKVYVCNVMTQPGESDAMSASDHVRAILDNLPARAFDLVLVNTAVPGGELMERYEEVGQSLVAADTDRVRGLGVRPVPGDYMSQTNVVRHDPAKLTARLMGLLGL